MMLVATQGLSWEFFAETLSILLVQCVMAAFALTEPGSGSDLASLRTRAVRVDGDGDAPLLRAVLAVGSNGCLLFSSPCSAARDMDHSATSRAVR